MFMQISKLKETDIFKSLDLINNAQCNLHEPLLHITLQQLCANEFLELQM